MDHMDDADVTPREERIAALVGACSDRLNAGEAVDLDAVAAQHAELEPELGLALEAIGRLTPASPASRPRELGDYRIDRELGRGGMGIVYEAHRLSTGQRVALKVLPGGRLADPSSVARFEREARLASLLDHPGICTVYDAGVIDGLPFIAMRFVEGESLGRRIRSRRSGPPAGRDEIMELAEIVERAARALHEAHEAGLVHRDVKPENIMVTPGGEPVLLDFGLARSEELELSTLTRSGSLLGTPAYMAPEQLGAAPDSRADRRSDVYSLGATLYECLTLRLPFEAPTRDGLYRRILAADPPRPRLLNAAVPRELEIVVETALAKEPDSRYRTALDLAEDIRRVRASETIRARPAGPVLRLGRWTRRNPALAAATLGIILVLALGLAASLVLLGVVSREKTDKELALETVRAQKDDLARLLEGNRDALRRQEGLRLTAQSALTLAESPGLALLLAVEGARRHDSLTSRNAVLDSLMALRESLTLIAHRARVDSASFSAGGRRVVTGSNDGTIRIWDARSGELLRVLVSPGGPVGCAAFSPDGSHIASGDHDQRVRLWRVDDGTLERTYPRMGSCSTVAFSPDGRRILGATFDGARLFDVASGEVVRGFRESGLRSGAISPDGGAVLTAGDSGLRVRRVADGATVLARDGKDAAFFRAWFDADGAGVLGVARDGTVVHMPFAGRAAEPASLDLSVVVDAAFAPGAGRIATAERDATARIRDARDGAVLLTLGGHEDKPLGVEFDARGARLVTTAADGTARIWELGAERGVLGDASGSSRTVAIASGRAPGGVILVAENGRVTEWDAEGARLVSEVALEGVEVGLVDAALDPGGGRLVARGVAGGGGTVAGLWDSRSGLLLRRLQSDSAPVWAVAIASGGARAILGGRGFGRLVDPASGEVVRALPHLDVSRSFAAFSPDGRRAVCGMKSRAFHVVDLESGLTLFALGDSDTLATSAAFSPGGERIVTALLDHTARVWDAESGAAMLVLRGHDDIVTDAAFSPDGRLVATGSDDRTARVWDASTGEEVLTLRGHRDTVGRVVFTAGGSYVVTLAAGVARAWPLDPVAAAERSRPRDLTPDEMDRHEIGSAAERSAYRLRWSCERLDRELRPAMAGLGREPVVRGAYRFVLERLGELVALERDSPGGAAPRAVELAGAAVERTGRRDADLLGLLADALAVERRAREAVAVLEEAIRLPDATRALAGKLAGLRAALAPDLPTCASIDAALVAAPRDGSADHPEPIRERFAAFLAAAANDPTAAPRVAYLEGRLLALEGRHREAMGRFERSAVSGSDERALVLEAAASLRALGEPESAAARLADALASRLAGDRGAWERWFELRAVDIGEPAAAIQAALGTETAPADARGDIIWLLASLERESAVRINCGGGEYDSSSGATWGRDRFFLSGFRYFGDKQGGAPAPFDGEITGTDDDALYRTERWFPGGMLHPAGYRVPLPRGSYRVTLHFAEIFPSYEKPGQRVFDVVLEAKEVLESYDPCAAAGHAAADARSFEVDVEDGFLDVLFTPRVEAPKVAAIEIERS